MNELFIWFWAILIFASIAWYAFLLFYIGAKGGKEILQMTRALAAINATKRTRPECF